jgi:hypothetical protein
MVARALAIAHTCMYDAWAAYDGVAVGTTDPIGSRRRLAAERSDANKAKAISFAAYRCLGNLYPDGSLPPPLAQPSVRLNAMLVEGLGYSLAETCATDDECRAASPDTAAGMGNLAQAVIDAADTTARTSRRPGRPRVRCRGGRTPARRPPTARHPRIPTGPARTQTTRTWPTAIRRTSRPIP